MFSMRLYLVFIYSIAISLSSMEMRESSRSFLRVLIYPLAPVITTNWNSTGHATNISGFAPHMFDLIAQRMNFDYTWVPLGRDLPVDNEPNGQKGLISLAREGKGDIIVGTVVRTVERYQFIDYTKPTFAGPFGIMIPMPKKVINKNAIYSPFKCEVWVSVSASLVIVIIVSYLLQKFAVGIFKDTSFDTFSPVIYAITVLLNQGNECKSRLNSIRLIAGVWCLAAFVLVPAYSGNLLSYIMAPRVKPLVDSIFETVQIPGLIAVVDRGRAADLRMITNSKVNSTLGRVAATIQKTIFRCNESSECVQKVLEGDHVYIHGMAAIDQMLINDFAKTGECRLSKAKEPFHNGYLTWALPKKSPHLDIMNNGILELDAFGFTNYWRKRFTDIPNKCLKPSDSSRHGRISLPVFSTSFVLFGIGCALALFAFLCEITAHGRRMTAAKPRYG